MQQILAPLHADERREVLWAVGTVFLVLVAHALLETARDALFLAHLPASHLPWVYLALAALAMLGTSALRRSAGPRGDLYQLIIMQILAALGTSCFLVLTRAAPRWEFYALYIWGGLASTVILIRFWLLLTDRFNTSEAKRLFPIIAAGPLLGSLVGYGIAGVLSHRLPPAALLGASAATFLLSAGGSFMLWRAHAARPAAPAPERPADVGRPARWLPPDEATLRESLSIAIRHPYVRRVALLLLMASVTATIGDFIFKSVVAHVVAPHRLGAFLATAYFVFDLAALALLFTAVMPFVRSRGVTEALALQPVLLLGGGVLLTTVGGLAAVLCLRGIDGALRWSLHKTTTELLYVPLSPRLRGAVKAVSDVIAHRGGQAVGSLLILGWLSLAATERTMGPIVIGCAGLWIYLAMSLRHPYLDLFRETLGQESTETRLEFPDLDMTSLETLITALSNPDENKVIAAMYLLQQTNRVRLIPTLILYHPSPNVVLRALELLSSEGRDDFLPLTERLAQHPDTAVRAAAIRAAARVRPDLDMLKRASQSESPSVAVTALVALAAHGGMDRRAVLARLEPFLSDDAPGADEVRGFIARALRDQPLSDFAPLLVRLAAAPETTTRREAVLAMGVARDERHLPVLINLLAPRGLRAAARDALLGYGEAAFVRLQEALHDPSLPRAVRIQLPLTIARFPAQPAADVLLRQLLIEPSGTVRFKILRGLGRLAAGDRGLELDPGLVDEVIRRQLIACFQVLHWRVALQRGLAEAHERRTIGSELLAALLQEKEALGVQRLFRALGLKYRDEDLERIYDGLQNRDAAARASSLELLGSLLPVELRKAVAGLVEELPDEDRLAAARGLYVARELDYVALLAHLIGATSAALCCIAAYHAGELGLTELREALDARRLENDERLASLCQRSFAILTRQPAVARRGAVG